MAERTPDPATLDEYNVLQHAHARIEGSFLETAMVAPCPGCCAPDWSRWKVVEVEKHLEEAPVCKNCGRGFRAILTKNGDSVTSFEFVQTEGPDCPPIRRVGPEAKP